VVDKAHTEDKWTPTVNAIFVLNLDLQNLFVGAELVNIIFVMLAEVIIGNAVMPQLWN